MWRITSRCPPGAARRSLRVSACSCTAPSSTRSGIVIWTCDPGNGGKTLEQRSIVVPRRHDRDASRPAANRQLAFPLPQEIARSREPLSAPAVAEATDTSDDRFLERHAVIPAVGQDASGCAFERSAKPDARVTHSDLDHAPPQPPLPSIRLNGDPSAAPGVLDDVLADFGQRHDESDRGLRIDIELAREDLLGALLDPINDLMHVRAFRDRGDLQQNV